ncbi:bifunctional ADP-dependent NAD(P)H-hydrate dehydratase/NAD(P)H-hydrate epimerase [Chamaesiphon minutus]|uniref:Bifunctional NAD(P)H-hydrate repair enzyme n=1 Tax=Chamaesiphon minutus (strain ATCC 27169 / PCC 6605) TaxID=1173020 RepID=K9UPN3_CHAP6|nr:yjeF-like protein, hydroxyethylthiazole kinase-related protein [Chamaesiphon minutus PCC 6605]
MPETMRDRDRLLARFLVSTEQMQQIESKIFAAGMPVAALMEKVGGLIARRFQILYPRTTHQRVGILVGMGHNGGDALVVARELYVRGYEIAIYVPSEQLSELTNQHYCYVSSLGVRIVDNVKDLTDCDVIIDGLFGFGLNREISGNLFEAIELVNKSQIPVVSIDLPSGIQADTGCVLGIAIKATVTLCLGIWKLAFIHEQAIAYLGRAELIDFDIPLADIQQILGKQPTITRMTADRAISNLPLPRSSITHKYHEGHLLLVVGSAQYSGAAILSSLGARATGIGMLSIAVPASLKPVLLNYLPEALIIGCPETEAGTIKSLPELDFNKYQAIACGCGLTERPSKVVKQILAANCPIVLDADALNIIAKLGTEISLSNRSQPTILTPHIGEFKRLFTKIPTTNKLGAASAATQASGAVILVKGARTVIAHNGRSIVIPDSTPALARGGSGDILTGLIGGLIATDRRADLDIAEVVATAAWWHSQAAILAATERSELGVDPLTLIHYLNTVISTDSNNLDCDI